VTVLARLSARALDRALAGWRRICESDEPGSYEWLLERATSARRAAASAF
jgi:SH3-like domain-containing protein